MSKTATRSAKRINITLPEPTLRLLDRVAPKGDRSRLIADAVMQYIKGMNRSNLRKLMKERALTQASLDREIAEEWFSIDEEAWQRHGK